MTITIGKRANVVRHRSVFVAEVTFMSGDADHYDHEEIILGAEAQDVEQFLDLVTKMRALDHYYRPGETEERRNYGYPNHKQPGEEGYVDLLVNTERAAFIKFFGASDDLEEEWLDEWPRDVTYDDIYQGFDGASIFWYDENGEKFTVDTK